MSRGSSSLHGRRAAQQPARSLIRPYRAGDPRDPGSENLMRSPHYPSAAGAGPLETTSAKASRRAGRRGPARRPPQGTPGARAQTEHWANWPQRGSHTPPIQGERRSPRAEGTRPPPATKREERANEGALVRAPKPGGRAARRETPTFSADIQARYKDIPALAPGRTEPRHGPYGDREANQDADNRPASGEETAGC